MNKWLLSLALTLCADVAFAEPSTVPVDAITKLVDQAVLASPRKAAANRKRFSRARVAAFSTRTRVLDTAFHVDARGRQFVRFTLDKRADFDSADEWTENWLTGCAYPNEREVFLRRDEGYVRVKGDPWAKAKPTPGACAANGHLHSKASVSAPPSLARLM